MNLRRIMLLSLLVAFAVGLLAPISALAAGGGSSAGDQQYVDPLGGNSGNSGSGSHSSSNSGAGSSGSSSSSSSNSGATSSSTGSTGSVSSSSAPTTAAAGSTTSSSARTLPFTGFDTTGAIALGVVLIGSGFVLRRRILRA